MTGRSDAGHGRSQALAGRERVRPDRPSWAATVIPDAIDPLPVMTAAAAARPDQQATSERLFGIDQAWHSHGWPPERAELRESGAAIRRETLADLDGYLDQLQRMVESHGGTVHHAADAAGARDTVTGIVERIGAQLVVKSKSMATEEIHLNQHLESQGLEVVETDLGEYICQLADERPSHIIAPVIHKSQGDIHALFQQLADDTLADEPEALTAFARVRLRQDFAAADVGISGVNFAAADTGTLAIVSNEGNARMVTSRPRVHIAVMPVEKVIPRLTDLGTLLPLLTRSATNQPMSVYQSLLTGPRRDDDPDGPDELHLVIVDNGRRRLLGTPYEQVLACIRCGACQVACPVYRTVGGHAYGTVYGGPIGAVLSPLLGDGEEAAELPYLSSLCGRCDEVCPVEIPLSDLLVDLRADHQDRRGPTVERTVWRAWAAAWSRPWSYWLLRRAAALGGYLPARLQRAIGPARGWAQGRTLPSPRAAGALRHWLDRRSGRGRRGRRGGHRHKDT